MQALPGSQQPARRLAACLCHVYSDPISPGWNVENPNQGTETWITSALLNVVSLHIVTSAQQARTLERPLKGALRHLQVPAHEFAQFVALFRRARGYLLQ